MKLPEEATYYSVFSEEHLKVKHVRESSYFLCEPMPATDTYPNSLVPTAETLTVSCDEQDVRASGASPS